MRKEKKKAETQKEPDANTPKIMSVAELSVTKTLLEKNVEMIEKENVVMT